MANRPQLLFSKREPPHKKKGSDDDKDYDPNEDQWDTEDTLEDVQLENQTVDDTEPKCDYFQLNIPSNSCMPQLK